MSTICFDIKRVDDDYVCIQHCDLNKFEYEYHLPFSFYPRTRKGKEHWWLSDKKYRYVWLLVGTEDTGIERIFWACNDKTWLNSTLRAFKDEWSIRYKNIRFVKLPFELIEKVPYEDKFITRYNLNDMQDKFKIYCPVKLNEEHHVYADHYEEIEPVREVVDSYQFEIKQYKWIPPKMLGEE